MTAELARDAADPADYPQDGLPEIAILGRSNAGKSSLLNALVGRRRLARTSATPGKTRRVQFYRVQGALYLVDLPGYGYAAASREERRAWRPLVERYLDAGRPVLRGCLLLMDARRALADEERELAAWLALRSIPLCLVLSKADKLGSAERARARQAAVRALAPAAVALASARTGSGLGEVARQVQAWTGAELRRPDGLAFAG